MEIPDRIARSQLWRRLSVRPDHVHIIAELRAVAGALGRQVERTIPDYTDHSLRHMDALWAVSDQVLSPQECGAVTPAEALILGACFYVHDLGMAFAATAAGAAAIRATSHYTAALERLTRVYKLPENRADVLAVRLATREVHAHKALDLCSEPLPGLGRYLIESSEGRERWANAIGQVAASHHWDLDQVHRVLGIRNAVPTADGDTADLGFLACVLRIIDYAHINRERASNLDRALRSEISADSVVHWDAQASVTGPIREDDVLVYGCTGPVEDVDAWWLFYDLASGLDAEIRAVREYLRGRAVSASRFSLQGVKGVELPQTFVHHVQLAGDTAPIDIRVQPHSMERLVELLGGRRLYGRDRLAPLRELIQNARDAIELRNAVEHVEKKGITSGQILVGLDEADGRVVLSVRDNGVGMTQSVVVRYLIGVGSDFWHSAEFYRDYGRALDYGFRPIGRFGIGFLSVFMFGDYIEVDTEAAGASRVLLRLRGLGRRGELKEVPATGEVGTEVRIWLKPDIARLLREPVPIVRARAPMLQIPVLVRTRRGSSVVNERIEPGWWKHIENSGLSTFVSSWDSIAHEGEVGETSRGSYYRRLPGAFGDWLTERGWPGLAPSVIKDGVRVFSSGGAPYFGVIRCSQGIAVDGESVLTESSLRWIPVLEPPGNLIHYSRAELVERLRQHNRLVLASGVNPGSAYGTTAPYIPSSELGQMLIVAIRVRETRIDFSTEDRLKHEHGSNLLRDTLGGIAEKIGATSEGSLYEEAKLLDELVLIRIVFAIVGEAWGVESATIEQQSWTLDLETHILWADLTREAMR